MVTLKKIVAASLSACMMLGTASGLVSSPILAADENLSDPALIPKPVECTFKDGVFTLTDNSDIVISSDDKEDLKQLDTTAQLLAARLRKSTGYPLEVKSGEDADSSDILLTTNQDLKNLEDEGYTLTSGKDGVVISAYEPAGVYNGTQTLRQMFNSDIEKQEVVENGDWRIKEADITDKPEYGYRGMHLDVARHFFTVEEVERQIDLISQFKINKLHMHLSDDQGWRLEIKGEMYGESLSKLLTIGDSRSCSTNSYEPGYYTQEQFKELVAYAADRNIEIIPEFDMPALAWAALVSLDFLSSTEDGKPHAGNYNNSQPYDGYDVGWASLEVHNEKTYAFIEEVVRQVSEISPCEIINLGGDEAHSTAKADFNYFMQRVAKIGNKYGKKVMGWQNFDDALLASGDKELQQNNIVQYWQTNNSKLKGDLNYVVTPAHHAYMDMKYDNSSKYGLTWATLNPVDDSYKWDPTEYGSKEHIIGIECCLWTETINDNYALDYMIYPRVAGHAEVGWTPKDMRSWDEYKTRIAQYDTRLVNEGVSLRRDEIIWPKPYVPVNSSFSFEEGQGSTVSDNEGEYTGSILGNPEFVDGVRGKAIHFDGNTCIDINREDDMTNLWTASMWVKREASSGTNAVLISGNEGEIKLDQWKNTGKVGLTKFSVVDEQFNYSAPLDEWVHLAFVSNGSSTTLYVNGEKNGSVATAIKGPFKRIGHCAKSNMESTGFMNGAIDELKMFNRAYSDAEIAELYRADTATTKDDVNKLIEEAQKYSADGYTAESFAALAAAIEAARAAVAKENATSEELKEAYDALDAAIRGLKPFVPEDSIRIASYNLAAGKKPDLKAMNDQLKDNAVAIAGVQEIDVNTGRNNFDMLERIASYGTYTHTSFQKAIDYSGGQYGVGIISSLESKNTDGGMLFSEGIDEPRAWQKMEVEKDGHTLVLYNTHLTHENRAIRKQQLEEVLEIVKNDPAEYKAITGDFNTDQDLAEWLPALKDFNLSNGHNGQWLNTFNGSDDAMRVNAIDNVITTRNLKINDVYMVENKLSDHNMLVSEVQFLDKAEVSTDYMDWVLKDAKALDTSIYSAESVAALEAAIAAAEGLAENATQEQVDAAADAITAAVDGLTAVVRYINDSDTGTGLNQYNFIGEWKTSVNYPDLFYGGDEHWINTSKWTSLPEVMPGYTITFNGTGIDLFGVKDVNLCIYEVSIDGGEPVDCDPYGPRTTQQCFFSVRDLEPGQHTVKVTMTDRKNPSSERCDMECDYAIVYNEIDTATAQYMAGIRSTIKGALAEAEF